MADAHEAVSFVFMLTGTSSRDLSNQYIASLCLLCKFNIEWN